MKVNVNKDGNLIVISGPSGVGKDTVCSKLLENNKDIFVSISATTRNKRKGEKEGVDYYFKTQEEFKDLISKNELLEYALVHEKYYYGTLKKPIMDKLKEGRDVLLIIDIQGALQIKKQFEQAIFIFILPPSLKELMKRLINRKTESKDEILNRFKSTYKEINAIYNYNYVVVNDEVLNCVKKIEAILLASKCRVDRIMDLELNTKEDEIHEMLIDL